MSDRPVFHLHPPKTAGSSIVKTANMFFSKRVRDKLNEDYSAHLIPSQAGIQSSEPMSLSIRNPYQQFVSQRRFYPTLTNMHNKTRMFYNEMIHFNRIKSQQLLDLSITENIRQFVFWANLSDWRNLATGTLHIIKFETLQEDFTSAFCIDVSLPNIHNRGEYAVDDWHNAFPSQEHLDQFNQIKNSDFELGNYDKIYDINKLFKKFLISG